MKHIIIDVFSIFIFMTMGFFPVLAEGVESPTATHVGSYSVGIRHPVRIALDSEGRLYVTDTNDWGMSRIYILSNSGTLISTIDLGKGTALGITVDNSGKIYVGDERQDNVRVFDSSGQLLYKLGSGDGEFDQPNSIKIASATGNIYVDDTTAHSIKVYNPDGSFKFSFGDQGSADGYFGGVYGLAINDSTGELIAADWNNADTNENKSRIQIFDLDGNHKFSFYTYNVNNFYKIQGPSVDKHGRIYVPDMLDFHVQCFDRDTGASLGLIGTPSYNGGELYKPRDTAIDADNKLFVVSSGTQRIEVYGLDTYNTLDLSPQNMSFTVDEGGPNPSPQTLSITNKGNGQILNWTAAADSTWLAVNPSSGAVENSIVDSAVVPGSGSSQVQVSVNATSLLEGTYKGVVTIKTTTGIIGTVSVDLTVNPSYGILNVSPASLSFKAQQGGTIPPSQKIYISNTGNKTMNWSASVDQTWINLDPVSGTDNSTINITTGISALSAGTYNGKITIMADRAQGSPATVNVNLNVIHAGTIKVTTNLDGAGFDITRSGEQAAAFSGTGKEWSNDEVTPGDYNIAFKHVSGYIRPLSRTFTVKTGNEVDIDVQYRAKPAATHIVAGSGSTKGKKVVVMNLDGTTVSSFEPFKSPESVRVAAGDMDGSGIDKIAVTDKKRTVKVYTYEGTELDELTMPEGYKKAIITTGDIDGDGKAEIIIGAEVEGQGRTIKRFAYADGKIEEKDTLYTDSKYEEFTAAVGDTDGDGNLELVMADKDGIKVFEMDLSAEDGKKLTEIWTTDASYGGTPEVAAGDINDDGTSEIALSITTSTGTGKDKKEENSIKILKGTGEDYGLSIDAYGDLGYKKPSTVALGDIDGDGVDEIAAGAGRDEHNDALIRTFESDGTSMGSTITAMDSKFGVNVTLGRFK
ncbi:MAG: FG-GAP repeat protein [Nitrospirae bacterium]|nr:FG-GAP repeat protein [Nitrospirota bacterium]